MISEISESLAYWNYFVSFRSLGGVRGGMWYLPILAAGEKLTQLAGSRYRQAQGETIALAIDLPEPSLII